MFTNSVFSGYFDLFSSKQVAKTGQKIFMQWDRSFFDARTGKSLIVQSSTLNEDLGQIERIFSDKTGTLTQNIMEFKVQTMPTSVFLPECVVISVSAIAFFIAIFRSPLSAPLPLALPKLTFPSASKLAMPTGGLLYVSDEIRRSAPRLLGESMNRPNLTWNRPKNFVAGGPS